MRDSGAHIASQESHITEVDVPLDSNKVISLLEYCSVTGVFNVAGASVKVRFG